jgi:predicted dehydrogenase
MTFQTWGNHMSQNRREFMKRAAAVGGTLGASRMFAQGQSASTGRVLGANDRIQVGVIGVGGRGTYVGRTFSQIGKQDNSCQIVAVCDVYQKRLNQNKEYHDCKGYLDYREVLELPYVDAVIVATPDHWHAPIALAAMKKGKDVYCEKPMCHTIDQAKELAATVHETKRVMQVGSQTTSADQWHKAKKYIADGAIGKMIMSQGSYHRNSTDGEWNWPIEASAGPNGKGEDYIDWKMWLGSAPAHSYDADRFFRFRKYWDYSGGIATDLFFHVVAPLNICWPEPQFPLRVSALGGIWQFKDEREVPDTFNLIADFPQEHSLVLSSSMANSRHIPGLIRGHKGTIVMVDHGMFEGRTDHITLTPETRVIRADEEYKTKFGDKEQQISVDQKDAMAVHVRNFLECIRSRQNPTLNVDVALRAQVTISMAVQSYREGRVLYWDNRTMKVTPNRPA